MFGDDELIKHHRGRAAQVANVIFVCFFIICLRLWYLQVYRGEQFHKFSIENRLRKEVVRAPRGLIYSRDNYLLVDNIPRFDAILTRQFLKDKDKTFKRLSEILDMPVDAIQKTMDKMSFQARYRPIIIKKNVTLEEVARIETENAFLPGVSIDTFISREYKDKEVGAHMLGYISEINQRQLPRYRNRDGIDYKLGDFIGQFGVEEKMDRLLRGENGYEYVEVDALGRKKKYINTDNLFKGIKDKKPTPGSSLRLTIDRDMQMAAYTALEGKTGSVVALDVHTGEILAMVSRPSFDPSQFSRGLTPEYWNGLINNPDKPLRDRNIQDHFSPGSTFKPFTAIAALEEGLIDPNTRIRCHGSLKFGRKVYHSWKKYGTETVNVVDALMQSCNIFFYKVATEMDIDVLAKYASMFGFGKRTGVALPREVAGLFPTSEWKLKKNGEVWQQGETLSCSIGQSYVLTTTMQLASAYAAIANNGTLYRPYMVKEVIDDKGQVIKEFKPEVTSTIKLKQSTWEAIRKGLYKVANDPKGTAFWKRGEGNQMAGKTGTSQVVRAASVEQLYSKCTDLEYKHRHHGVFVAFAPYDEPKIAVATLIEHGCGGSTAAAPVTERVISTFMHKYMPEQRLLYAAREKADYAKVVAAQKKKAEEEERESDTVHAEEDASEDVN